MRELRVDPIQCQGRGLCAAAAPALVSLDEWGYPLLADGTREPITSADERAAKRAVRACPRLALALSPR
ncbi:MAG: ferredoxin [Actinobacteria bacterium]|nr:ferredoxin [Actinomycetota bacterium]